MVERKSGAGPDVLVDAGSLLPPPRGPLGRRRNLARARLVAGLADFLTASLSPGERVRWAARACRRVASASSVAAWAASPVERVAIVVTDRRLLLIQLDGRGRPAARREQVALDRVRGTHASLFRPWRIDLADGTALLFVAVSAIDRRRLGALLFARPGPRTSGDVDPLVALRGGGRREVA